MGTPLVALTAYIRRGAFCIGRGSEIGAHSSGAAAWRDNRDVRAKKIEQICEELARTVGAALDSCIVAWDDSAAPRIVFATGHTEGVLQAKAGDLVGLLGDVVVDLGSVVASHTDRETWPRCPIPNHSISVVIPRSVPDMLRIGVGNPQMSRASQQ